MKGQIRAFKVLTPLGECVMIFSHGEMQYPIALLDETAINEINKEWKRRLKPEQKST